MKINYVLAKRFLIAILGSVALYYLIMLIFTVTNHPQDLQNNFNSISSSQFIEPLLQNQSSKSSSGGFDYKLVGYRASDSRSSVIVEKNNETFVVQQSDLLENRYKLISVDAKFAIFEENGKRYQLSTNLKINN
ncbi:hypothetical protein OAY28_06235 [Gammaproteobacteria bacterium]|nr:hypothetical protein [Gammaproteobacteria bacterium]MDC3381904.1 hypothetical protein [Gammaproteobacteria bacterium]|tara:strand:- start:5150 stop:5551 length:402 start_codon:yes stop_codon:yes gene_type:complete